MKPVDLPKSSLLTALNGAKIVYFDGRLHETALVVAHEVITFIIYLMRVVKSMSNHHHI